MIVRNRLLVGAAVGVVGGALAALLTWPEYGWLAHLLISALLGAFFGLVFGSRLHSAGSALIWGQAFGLLWWLLGPLTFLPLFYGEGILWSVPAIRANYALLPANVIIFGAILGLGSFFLSRLLPILPPVEKRGFKAPDFIPPWKQAVIVGGIGGLFGAWIFLRGVETADFFPIVAGIIGMDSYMAGAFLHYTIGMIIAITFALLFYRDIRGVGPAMIYGMSYGIQWWFIGPQTLLPILTGAPIEWSLETASANYAPLLAHVLYGAMIGFFFAVVNTVWRKLFIDSDPLRRTREGGGTTGIRGILMGVAGGLLGGLLFTFVLVGIGALPAVANLVGSQSSATGLLVHLTISVIIGITYGLFFQRVGYSYGAGIGWGVLYGLLWWVIGAMTLFAFLLRQPIDWSLAAAAANYAALIGHLLYGLGLGLFFQFLARRYDAELRQFAGRSFHSAAPAMWAAALLFGVMLPLLLIQSP
ncbi:MAG: hypothetical protein R3293_11850 [Candidatus Promineifilaceae bacterium]|nr:hypothetical protein [Candidatus Promineifilaceae bacterium]